MEWSATATAGQAAQVLGGRKAWGGEDHGQPPPPTTTILAQPGVSPVGSQDSDTPWARCLVGRSPAS